MQVDWLWHLIGLIEDRTMSDNSYKYSKTIKGSVVRRKIIKTLNLN